MLREKEHTGRASVGNLSCPTFGPKLAFTLSSVIEYQLPKSIARQHVEPLLPDGGIAGFLALELYLLLISLGGSDTDIFGEPNFQ